MQTFKKKKEKILHRICKYIIKPVEIFSVFGIKRHRTQFYFHIRNVSVCVSSWSAPLSFTLWSRSGSLLLSLVMLRPGFLGVCVRSFKRPTVLFKHKTFELNTSCSMIIEDKETIFTKCFSPNWETSKNKGHISPNQSESSLKTLGIYLEIPQ